MKNISMKTFQNKVEDLLTRHKSILDILTKCQESAARVNRAVIKSVTSCGCLKINANKQVIPTDIDFSDIKNYMDTHLKGILCDNCLDVVENELGNHLFYLAGLANTLHLSLGNILACEADKMSALGRYHLR